MTAGCPCLLSDARNPQIRREGGRRVLSWTCKVCGSLNSETSEYPPQRNGTVGQAHGGARAGAAVGSAIDPSVTPPTAPTRTNR